MGCTDEIAHIVGKFYKDFIEKEPTFSEPHMRFCKGCGKRISLEGSEFICELAFVCIDAIELHKNYGCLCIFPFKDSCGNESPGVGERVLEVMRDVLEHNLM